jgi:hypothetical protein
MRVLPVLIAIFLGSGAALAQLPAALPIVMNLPVVGLASSETAQVNVAYLLQTTLEVLPANATPSTPSCTGTITFYNAAGSALGTPASFSITTGQIYSTTLPYSDVTGSSGNGRTVIRAAVTTNAPCAVNTNIETYDTATGVTHVHVEGPSAGIFPNIRIGVAR